MTDPRHKVVFIKDHYKVKDKNTGEFKPADTSTLYIRSYQPKGEKQHKKISLEIRLKNNDIKSLWDTSDKRFKLIKKNPYAQVWNEKIDSELKKLGNYKNLNNIPERRKSFLTYWDNIIRTTDNHGSRIKHQGVRTKLQKFLGNGVDLYFSEITHELVRSIYHNFKTVSNPKRLKIGTANHYMKIIHSIINISTESRYFNYDIDPFVGLDYNDPEQPILEGKVLDGIGLRLLLEADSKDDRIVMGQLSFPDELKKYRLSLLFQLFANGMRVSDMLTLRWNNFDGYVLRYNMFKTNKSMKMPMNINLINILCKIILLSNPKNRLLSYIERFRNGKHTAKVVLSELETVELNLTSIEKRLSAIDDKHVSYHALNNGREELIIKMEHSIAMDICIWYRNGGKGNEFVFPYLKNEDFADIDGQNNFNQISEKQYKMIKHNTIVYNRNLKKIKDYYGFKINLTSHAARHSFASLLLSMGDVNTFDIQQMLGHSSIQITDKYLQKHFNSKKLDNTNRRLSNTLGIK